MSAELFEYLLRLGDDRLVLGHRLSEWCGHAPILEEDLALANIALDLIGQANAFLTLAGKMEGNGRSADDLAYFREAIEYRNLHLVEQPCGDFAYAIVKQFLFSGYSILHLECLSTSSNRELAGISAKALKESRYHLRHAGEWVLRLGDGTEESRSRAQAALNDLWIFTGEMFEHDQIESLLISAEVIPAMLHLEEKWRTQTTDLIDRATLAIPRDSAAMATGGRRGLHGECLGHMLSDMQILARSFPGAKW